MSHETNSPVMQVVAKMQDQFHSYGVNVTLEPVLYIRSETFLMFRVKLGEGAKMKTVFHCAEDIRIAMNLAQFYPFVKWNQLFLAVYKTKTLKNSLQRMLESPTFQQQGDKMLIALGYDIINAMVFEDLTQMTHVLYAGATNSGKSFGLVSFMVSLMVGQPVSKVNFVVLDIGGSTLDVFENTPHLSHPIVTDVDTGVKVIGAVTQEMNRRIEAGWEVVKTLPHIVCVIDEFALFMDTMMKHPDGIDVKNQISDLLRRGRKAKIHVVIATQDTRVKTMQVSMDNISTRMMFQCAKFQTSCNVINCAGAEKLPGNGAMLYLSAASSTPVFVQGAYMKPQQLAALVESIRLHSYDLSTKFVIPETMDQDETEAPTLPAPPPRKPVVSEKQKRLAQVILWALGQDTLTISGIKSQFSIGNGARDMMKFLETQGIVSGPLRNKARDVLVVEPQQLSQTTRNLLQDCGYSEEQILAAFHGRGGTSELDPPTEAPNTPGEDWA